jgi:hypothetical protein
MHILPYQSVSNQRFQNKTVIQLKRSDFNNASYDGTQTTFSFTNCTFNELIIENDEVIDFEKIHFGFIGCFIKRITIENIETQNIGVFFGNSFVSSRIANSNLANVYCNNTFTESLFLLNQQSVGLSFSKENIFYDSWAQIITTLYKQGTELWRLRPSFYIHDTQKIIFENNFTRSQWNTLLVTIFDKNQEDNQTGMAPKIRRFVALHLSIEYENSLDKTDVKLSNAFLHALTLRGKIEGQFSFENSLVDNLFIRRLSIGGEANFFNIRPLAAGENKIEIRESNLDNVWFDNVPFQDYELVSFYRTKFAKARFSSCSFPTNYFDFIRFQSLENVHYPHEKSDNYYKDQYEIFLQLKNALEAGGNFYESQKLQAISNDALMQVQEISEWDKFILWLNAKSNNHGLSIKLPLMYFFAFTIILYILYLTSINRIFNTSTIDLTLIGYYFSFIDPTHRLDFLVDKNKYNFGTLFIDFIGKIVSGYFIYQFIAAFRKYGKR